MIDKYIHKLTIDKLRKSCKGQEFTLFLGGVALFCLILGAAYWVRLIGFFNEPLWRFDLMPWNWKILCCTLAILYPIAACGLWMQSKWGVVLWLIGGLTEIICYVFYAKYFEFHLFLPLIHILLMIIYGMLTFYKIKDSRKKKETIAEY